MFIPPGTTINYHHYRSIGGDYRLMGNPVFSAVVVLRPKSSLIVGRVTKTTDKDFIQVGVEIVLGNKRSGLSPWYKIEKSPDPIQIPVIKQIVLTGGEIV